MVVYLHFIKYACDHANWKHGFASVNIIECDVLCRHWGLEMTNGYKVVSIFPCNGDAKNTDLFGFQSP